MVVLVDLLAASGPHGEVAVCLRALLCHLMRLGDLGHQVHGLGCGCIGISLPVGYQLICQELLELDDHRVTLEEVEALLESCACLCGVKLRVCCHAPYALLPELHVGCAGPLVDLRVGQPQRTKGMGQAKKQLSASCWSGFSGLCPCLAYLYYYRSAPAGFPKKAIHDKFHDCAAQVLCQTSLNLARLQQTSSWQHALHMPGI